MAKPKSVLFRWSRPGSDPVDLGRLPWPWAVQSVARNGDYFEVKDRHGTSVVALDDITLGDLYHE